MALDTQAGTKPVRWRERIGLLAIGHTTKQIEEFLFDWLLYGAVVAWCTTQLGTFYGSILAFAIMSPLSAAICYAYVKFYDWAKKDWFGFEAAKTVRDDLEGSGWFSKALKATLRMGDVPAFIALSLHTDPFMTTIYLRKGASRYGGLSRRDWTVFFGSVLFSNGYWTMRWTVLVVLASWAWSHVPESAKSLVWFL